ncbi:amino acid adenylation domain-containing protein [Pseudoalteromonas sp. ASV78]|uniref:amino acid adenylation domain-containing protein n=1 Tax=Pseudoalteromonas sp. ASV78 TaxID=3397851 RepID=UPI0039FD59AA
MKNNNQEILSKLNQLSPEQRLAILNKVKRQKAMSGGTGRPLLSSVSSITEIFENIAKLHPDNIAVIMDEQQISYGELNKRANRLAHYLNQKLLRSEGLVGLMCDRSIELIVAILAILKSGAAYVPLDPNNPRDRLTYIIKDSQLSLVLTQQSVANLFTSDFDETQLISVDHSDIRQELAGVSEENLPPSANTESLAYIIYTSGSTGLPKGVMVEHNNVMRLFDSCGEHYQFNSEDVWVLFHSYAFDFSVWEIFGALLHGGTLVIPSQDICRSPGLIAKLLLKHGVTVLNQTPTAFYNLMPHYIAQLSESQLRYIIFGGEALEPSKLKPVFNGFKNNSEVQVPQIVNMYGITETTVHASYYKVTAEDCAKSASPIGRLLNDLEGFVFSETLQPIPDQVVGELYISGAGVTRGYLHRKELTAERFINHPTINNLRLYRTGDLVKRMLNGEFHYVGRADQQVKIRGFRIELGEIESSLTQIPGISAAVVNPFESLEGDKNLAAYLVLKPGVEQLNIDEIVQQLHKQLPQYMIPVTFQYLETLPLNQNGKIERSALLPSQQTQVAKKSYKAPSSAVEKVIVDAWQSALDIEKIGVQDHFFNLGGDSIKSLAVVSKIRAAGYGIKIADLFSYPILEVLAANIQPQASQNLVEVVKPFALCPEKDKVKLPSGVTNAYPVSKLQEGMIFHYASKNNSDTEKATSLYHNVSRFSLDTLIDISAFKSALSQLISRHDILRTSFHMQGFSIPLQLVHESAKLPLEYTDLSALSLQAQEKSLDQAYKQALTKRLVVENAPLFNVHIHNLADDRAEMTWIEHHALLDGWSVEILFKELSELYQAELEQREAKLLNSPQYVNFIAAEQQAIANQENTEFWKNYLQGVEFASIPTPNKICSSEKSSFIHSLDFDLTAKLDSLAKQLKVSLKSIALAAHLHVLKTFSGEQDLITGLSLHGRPELEGSSQSLGLFVTVLPFRLKVNQSSWQQLIFAASEGERSIWQQRHFPLSCILDVTEHSELFKYSFNFLDFTAVSQDSSQQLNKVKSIKANTANEFKLSVNFNRMKDKRLQVGLTWDQQAFSYEQIQRIVNYYETTLRTMVAGPDASIYAISPQDQQELIAFNRTSVFDVSELSISSVFHQQAQAAPEKIAVRFAHHQLSYRELNEKSNQFARYLTDQGVAVGQRVAIITSRSLNMLVAMLGIIKLGASYVPIDVRYPIPRIKQMLKTSAANYVVYEDGAANQLLLDSTSSSDIDQAIKVSGSLSKEYVAKDTSSSLLNIIFTSGSTGEPKGVEVCQRGILRLFKNQAVRQLLGKDMVMLHLSALAFDAATEEIWLPLLSGGELILYPEPQIDLNRLNQVIKTYQVNTAFLTAALFERWVEQLPYGKTGLRYLTVGGDVLNPVSARRLYQKDSTVKLCNGYGPTENTVFSTFYQVPQTLDSRFAIPLGTPLDNTYAYVLDEHHHLAPIGSPGELFLGGDGLAKGYFNSPELTKHKFVEVKLPHEGCSRRLYKTGDQVYWEPDGTLIMLGRMDNQIKLRGFRIEPAEIERGLESHPSVNHAAVIVHEHDSGKKLVAYISGSLPDEIGEVNRVMKKFLKVRLPNYLVPFLIISIDDIPLTVNGKVDRKALSELSIDQALSQVSIVDKVKPSTETEEKLLSIWVKEISNPSIGVESNFFDLGGDSLSATRLVSVINQKFNISLALNQVFENQTIKELAEYIDANLRDVTKTDSMESLVF